MGKRKDSIIFKLKKKIHIKVINVNKNYNLFINIIMSTEDAENIILMFNIDVCIKPAYKGCLTYLLIYT